MKPIGRKFGSWAVAMALLAAACVLAAPGCSRKERKTPAPAQDLPGAAEFGMAQPLDLPPVSGTGQVSFDPGRHAAVNRDGDALVVYLGDDGSGTTRLHVVRYDHSRNPIVRYFNQPEVMDANTGSVSDAKVLIDDSGDGVLLWTQPSGGIQRLYGSVYRASLGAFSSPALLDAGGDNAVPEGVSGFDAAADAEGNVIGAFFENPAAGQAEAFGIYYDKAAGAFGPPDKADAYTEAGHPVSSVKVIAGTPGIGYVMILQDTDTGAPVVNCCSISRFTTESSLSSFNAHTRVNPPGHDGDVRDFTGVMLPDGDGLFLWEQDDPASGFSRIFSRRYDCTLRTFTAAVPQDLAPEASAATLGFEGPVAAARPDGLTVALFRTAGAAPVLHANVYDPAADAFEASQSRTVSAAGQAAGGTYLFAFSPLGSGRAVFTQTVASAAAPRRLFAAPFDGTSRAFGTPAPCDLGAVETGSLGSLPMVFSEPEPAGAGYDRTGRFLVAFRGSNGLLRRLFVNRGPEGDPARFEGARPVDGSSRSSVLTSAGTLSEVAAGGSVFLMAASGGEGLALWRQTETVGTHTTVRLHGNPYHGYNLARRPGPAGAQILDEHLEVAGDRSVSLHAAAATAAGAVVAFAQEAGGSRELYVKAYDALGNQFDLPGRPSQDNGSAGAVSAVEAVPGAGDDAFVFYLQDDGSGTVRLYGRRYDAETRSLSAVSGPVLSNTGGSYGSVTHLSAVGVQGRACVAFRQLEGADPVAFALRVDPDGTVTGPVRIGAASPAAAGPPLLVASPTGTVLVLFCEGGDLKGLIAYHANFGSPQGAPASLEPENGAVGSFEAGVDAAGDFQVVFAQAEASGGTSVKLARTSGSVWQPGPSYVSPQGTATLSSDAPRIRTSASGRSLVLFRVVNVAAVPADLSLFAVAFDPSSTPPLFSGWLPIDLDGTALSEQNVADFDAAVDPSSGRGFAFFRQDVEVGAPARPRLFARGFDLANFGSSTPIFLPTIADLGEGGASAQSETTLFDARAGAGGVGFLVHAERLAGSPAGPAHLFLRAFDAGAFTLGQAEVASRSMNAASGTLSNEGVDGARVVLTAGGGAVLLHTVTQTDSSTSTTYRRLFANVCK